jgi:hypothetical protein
LADTSKLSEHPVFSRALLRYSQKDPAVSTLNEFRKTYGADALNIAVNYFSLVIGRGTPEPEMERMITHALIVSPVVMTFAPECLASSQNTTVELEELSDYLYSHFLYDPASDASQEFTEADLLRGAVIEYYVGTSTDATKDHLRWLGSMMKEVQSMASVLSERQSIDRGLIESLASAASKPLMNGML